jgi:hypothetical protein
MEKRRPQYKVRSDVRSGAVSPGGGWIGGVWYPDKSGVCGSSSGTPDPGPTPPVSGGGWIGGVWYPDKSGTC